MKIISLSEKNNSFLSAFYEVEQTGETFVIYKNNKPIADLVPHKTRNRTTPHPAMSKIDINYDPTEVLSDDEWQDED